jgi:adenine-specific DNA methylase
MKRIIGYLGSKINLFDFLNQNMLTQFDTKGEMIFLDLFSGTGSVSKMINKNTNWDVIANDLSLYSQVLNSQILLYTLTKEEMDSLPKLLETLDQIPLKKGVFFQEFSMGGSPKTIDNMDIFGVRKKDKDGNVYYENNQEYKTSRMFFKGEVGQKIDTVKSELKSLLKQGKISPVLKDVLLLFLLNYVNKNSNYTGVYGAYLKYDKFKTAKPFIDKDLLEYIQKNYSLQIAQRQKNNKTIQGFADVSLSKLAPSPENLVIYMDPPYSTRSYEANYHILDYLCDFDFNISQIKHNSKSATKKSRGKNPFNSKSETLIQFRKLIKEGLTKSNNIFISYSNEGLVSQTEMQGLADELGFSLTTFTQEYKRYTSGENAGQNTGQKNTVNELLWWCKSEKK